MTDETRFERRVAILLASIADHMPADVDPPAMTRLAAAGSRRDAFSAVAVVRQVWSPGSALLMLALLATFFAGFVIGGFGGRSSPIVASSPTMVATPAAPARTPGDSKALVAQYEDPSVGWVLVYGDGRTIHYYESKGGTGRVYPMLERRLTPVGVDAVLAGALTPDVLLRCCDVPDLGQPDGTWADPANRAFAASTYAVCWFLADPGVASSQALDVLPLRVREDLLARQRSFDGVVSFVADPGPPVECAELDTGQARSIARALSEAGYDGWPVRSDIEYGTCCGVDAAPADFLSPGADFGAMSIESGRTRAYVTFEPILPHGSYVAWGAPNHGLTVSR